MDFHLPHQSPYCLFFGLDEFSEGTGQVNPGLRSLRPQVLHDLSVVRYIDSDGP